jgi:hypothetical protein
LGIGEIARSPAVSRLFLLLDRDPKLVSFQTLYIKLQSEAVVTLLLKSLDEDEFSTSRTAELANDSVQYTEFLSEIACNGPASFAGAFGTVAGGSF